MSSNALQFGVVCAVAVTVCGCATPPAASTPAAAAPTSVQAGDTTVVAVASPAKKCCTLPEFLGLNMLFKGIVGLDTQLKSYLGMLYPGLEPGVPLTPITGQTASSNPANSTAAQIKKDQDGAAQKIKSLRYLATIGCGGCYVGVEKAFLSALDDCTESVRFEAVKAIRETAGDPCTFCNNGKCCSPKIVEKLHQIAYEKNDNGCFKEPSERVRRLARVVMGACGGSMYTQPALPTEGPSSTAPTTDGPQEGPSLGSSAAQATHEKFDVATVSHEQSIDSDAARDADAAKPVLPTTRAGKNYVASQTRTTTPRVAKRALPVVEVRWERVTAPFHRFQSNNEARGLINLLRRKALGERVVGLTRDAMQQLEAETHSWTRPNAMPTKEMTRALQTTPLGEMSGVFEDRYGVHLVRILARRSAL